MPTASTQTDALLDAAILAARGSPNRVRRVGAVLLGADGQQRLSACNTFPLGVQDTEFRHQGNGRLVWMEHAERNAIYAAARAGMATEPVGSAHQHHGRFATWGLTPAQGVTVTSLIFSLRIR